MSSIRTSLIVGTVVVVLVALVAAGLLLYSGVRSALMAQFDRSLEDKARFLASTVEFTPKDVEVEFSELDMREFEGGDDAGYLQLWASNGQVLYRSPSLGGDDLEAFGSREEAASTFRWIDLSGDRTVRGVGFSYTPTVDQEEFEELGAEAPETIPRLSIIMAREAVSVHRFLDRLRVLLISIGLAAAVVAAGLLWIVVRRSLQPLRALAAQISTMGEKSLSSRVTLQRSPEEVKPIVDRLNDLLRRLDTAFQRERSFSSDVAHELRTPLAGLRSTMEVTLSRERSDEEYRESLGESLKMIRELQDMIEKLLYLGRLESGQLAVESRPTDLNELVRSSWKPLADIAARRHIEVEWKLAPRAAAPTDPTLLAAAARNILENAVTHANENGTVTIETSQKDGHIRFRVTNTGSDIALEDVPVLVQRFVQGDPSRSATGTHCGLGLTMVKSIAARLGHDLNVTSSKGGEFRVTLSI